MSSSLIVNIPFRLSCSWLIGDSPQADRNWSIVDGILTVVDVVGKDFDGNEFDENVWNSSSMWS